MRHQRSTSCCPAGVFGNSRHEAGPSAAPSATTSVWALTSRPQETKVESELFMAASCDRLRLRLPDPVPSPAGLVNAGSCGLRFFLGVGEEGGGPIYSTGSRSGSRPTGPQRRTASPKPPPPIGKGFLPSLGKIQAQSPVFRTLRFVFKISAAESLEIKTLRYPLRRADLKSKVCASRGMQGRYCFEFPLSTNNDKYILTNDKH